MYHKVIMCIQTMLHTQLPVLLEKNIPHSCYYVRFNHAMGLAINQFNYGLIPRRGVGNERNLVHLVEKSVEIKLKS